VRLVFVALLNRGVHDQLAYALRFLARPLIVTNKISTALTSTDQVDGGGSKPVFSRKVPERFSDDFPEKSA
jgi:hypothetical protein